MARLGRKNILGSEQHALTVVLTKSQYKALEFEALRRRIRSLSVIVREAVDQHLQAEGLRDDTKNVNL